VLRIGSGTHITCEVSLTPQFSKDISAELKSGAVLSDFLCFNFELI
jgi:hypothetical protein